MGYIANMLNSRLLVALSSDIKRNTKEHVMVVTLKSDEVLKQHKIKENEDKKFKAKEEQCEKSKMLKEVEKPRLKLFPNNLPLYIPPIPFPHKFQQVKLNK